MATGGGRGRRRGTRAAAAAAALALLVAGCSDDGGGDAGPGRAEPVVVPDEPVDGGRITLGLDGPVQADPLQASLASASDLMVLDLLHDSLSRLSPEGTPQPALATSWRSNGNRSAWRFTLDPEAKFSDGSAITADDVIASLERVAKLGESSIAALRLEHIKGFKELVDGTAERLEGLSAPDDLTVRVALDSPMSVLPQLLSSPVYGVVDVEAIGDASGADLEDLALSGSWSVDSAQDDEMVLGRRSDRPGHLEEVKLRSFEDDAAAYEAFDDGEVDWATVPGEELEGALERHGDGAFAPFHAELFFGMNVQSTALRNRQLRQAIAASIDREAIVEAVYDGIAEPLTGIVPAGVPGHDPGRCESCGHDPARAADLVGTAFPDGEVPEVHIDFDESETQEAMAEIVADGLEAAGIPVTLRPRPIEEYKAAVAAGEQELFSFGWIGLYGSPDAYLSPQLMSSDADNLTGLDLPEVDELLRGARGRGTPAERAELWAQAERQVLEAAVLVPVAQFRTQAVVSPRVQDLSHAVDGSVDWTQVWLAESL